jgi:hypothetical protein
MAPFPVHGDVPALLGLSSLRRWLRFRMVLPLMGQLWMQCEPANRGPLTLLCRFQLRCAENGYALFASF